MTDIQISHPNPPLNELIHYGVKGMKWGVRKDRLKNVDSMTYAQKQARIKKLHKELEKMDAELGIAGAGLRGHYGKKLTKKDLKKNPNYDWRKESPEKRIELSRQVTRKAVRGTMLRHGAAIAAGLVASNQAKRISLSNPKDAEILRAGAKYAGLAFSANAAVTGVQSIRAIRQEGREYDIRVELTKLGDKQRGR